MAIPMGMAPQQNNFMRALPQSTMSLVQQSQMQAPNQQAPQMQQSQMTAPQQQYQGAVQPMTAQNPVNSQQFGLAGAESAFNQGLQGAGQALQRGNNQALGTLQSGYSSALNQLGQGQQALDGNFAGGGAQVGMSAQQQQGALSGALGQQAQQEAFQQFNQSPGQQFLQDRGMRQIVNANSATGGIGGGNILSELQQQGQGLAQQDFQNQFNNLGQLSSQGVQVSGQNARNALSAANSSANLFGQGANISGQLAQQGAGIQQSQGTNIANLLSGTGNNIAQGRLQAGRDIANNVSSNAGALSSLANQQGQGLSDIVGGGSSNIANLLQGFGNMTAAQQQQLAIAIANMSVGEGTQQAGITQGVGQSQAAGALQQGQNQQNLLGNLTQTAGYLSGSQAPQAPQVTGSNMVNNSFIANNQQPGFGVQR
jgi:hypothetical protein